MAAITCLIYLLIGKQNHLFRKRNMGGVLGVLLCGYLIIGSSLGSQGYLETLDWVFAYW